MLRNWWQIYGLSALVVLSSCSVTKRLGPEERLLNKVQLEVLDGIPDDLADYEDVLRQRSNSSVVGLRIPMWFNLMVSTTALEESKRAAC